MPKRTKDTPVEPAPVDADSTFRIAIAERTEWPVDRISEHPENARKGDEGLLSDSMDEHGMYRSVVVQRSTGYVLAGNHTYRTAKSKGATHVPVDVLDVDDDEALRILLIDNRSNDRAYYDDQGLLRILLALEDTDRGLGGTGFDDGFLHDLAARYQDEQAEDTDDRDEGSGGGDGGGLANLDVFVTEPPEIPYQSVWRLGNHTLVVADVMRDWHLWRDYLVNDAVFAPYPTPYLPLSELASEQPLVMVQPDVYLASHVIEKWKASRGGEQVERVA